jgi:nucleoside-diphosphate-sugar epimerase
MRVFLAGATGVIGAPLVSQLLEAGHEVTAMTRSVLRAAQLEAAGAVAVACDVYDADGVRSAMADCSPDAVIHQLTSLPPRIDFADPHAFDANNRVRADGTRILVDAALATGARRVIAQSVAFVLAEHRRHGHAACRDHGEPGRDHRPRGGGVPGVWQQEGRAGTVQGPQHVAPALEIG